MSLEGRVHCDAPDCDGNAHVGVGRMKRGSLPPGFVSLRWHEDPDDGVKHFCGPECCMRWCAGIEPPEVIEI